MQQSVKAPGAQRTKAGASAAKVRPIPPKHAKLKLAMRETLQQLFRAPNDKPLEAYAK